MERVIGPADLARSRPNCRTGHIRPGCGGGPSAGIRVALFRPIWYTRTAPATPPAGTVRSYGIAAALPRPLPKGVPVNFPLFPRRPARRSTLPTPVCLGVNALEDRALPSTTTAVVT